MLSFFISLLCLTKNPSKSNRSIKGEAAAATTQKCAGVTGLADRSEVQQRRRSPRERLPTSAARELSCVDQGSICGQGHTGRIFFGFFFALRNAPWPKGRTGARTGAKIQKLIISSKSTHFAKIWLFWRFFFWQFCLWILH